MAVTYRVVLVEPEYEMNLGAVARLMENFGQKNLAIVNPKCEIGFTAKMHAKHAAGLLEGARVCKSVAEAVKGCAMAVGTSGVLRRHKKLIRNPITPRQFVERVEKSKMQGVIAILFGREGIGLSGSEIGQCDVLLTIPASPQYPVMNLSHAVAVVLYALTSEGKKLPKSGAEASWEEYAALVKSLEMLVDRQKSELRNLQKSRLVFRTVIGRAVPNETEVRCMLGVVRRTLRELDEKKKPKA